MPAAMEVLSMVTFPEGVAFSAVLAFIARPATNAAAKITCLNLFIFSSPPLNLDAGFLIPTKTNIAISLTVEQLRSRRASGL
jgi:hypothetical protein